MGRIDLVSVVSLDVFENNRQAIVVRAQNYSRAWFGISWAANVNSFGTFDMLQGLKANSKLG
jgi:hypothetical protein